MISESEKKLDRHIGKGSNVSCSQLVLNTAKLNRANLFCSEIGFWDITYFLILVSCQAKCIVVTDKSAFDTPLCSVSLSIFI